MTPASESRSTSLGILPKHLKAFQAEQPRTRAHCRPEADRRGICWLTKPIRGLAEKCKPAAADRLQIFLCYLLNSEVIDPLAGLQLCNQPARRLSSSRPGLGRPIRIPKLRNDGRIWAPPCRRTLALGFDATLELFQASFEYALLREQRGGKPGGDFLMECPQLIRGHRFEVIPVHNRPQS